MPRIGYNPKKGKIKTDADISIDRAFLAHIQVSAANAVAASDTGVHAAIAQMDGSQDITTNITNPAVPRALRIKGNQATVAGNVVIEGTNYAGEVITETIEADGANAVEGNKAFKTVTKITVPALAAEGDEISVGWNDKLGLPYKLSHNTVLAAYLDNTLEGTAPTVVVNDSNIENNTLKLNSTLNGSVVDAYMIV